MDAQDVDIDVCEPVVRQWTGRSWASLWTRSALSRCVSGR